MIKKTILSYFALVGIFLLLTVSCEITDTDCGPFSNRFKVTGFDTDLKNVVFTDTSANSVQLSPVETDTISFDSLGIHMVPNTEFYLAEIQSKVNFSFGSNAFACSPPPLTSEETITDIQVFSNRNYSNEFSSENNIASLFDIVVYYDRKGYQRFDLNDYISSNPETPYDFVLIPNTAPSSANSFQFTIKYFQDGLELDIFEFTTDPILIKN